MRKISYLFIVVFSLLICSCASDDTSVEPNPAYSKSQVLNDPRVITDESFDTVYRLLYISFHSIVANLMSILSETESPKPELLLLVLVPLMDLLVLHFPYTTILPNSVNYRSEKGYCRRYRVSYICFHTSSSLFLNVIYLHNYTLILLLL